MTLTSTEHDQMRLHVGIQSGFLRIERDERNSLVASKGTDGSLQPLPSYEADIDKAGMAFQYLSSPLLHDLNSMVMLLNLWEEELHPAPTKVLREKIEAMERWIRNHGGKA